VLYHIEGRRLSGNRPDCIRPNHGPVNPR
jgi:hypothetical protein